MIALHPSLDAAPPRERFAAGVLVDLAALAPAPADVATVIVGVEDRAPFDWNASARDLSSDWGIVAESSRVGVPRALLRFVADVAGAGAEQGSAARDRHGRVPSSENPLVRAGLEREPVVSRAALALARAARAAAGGRPFARLAPWPDGRRWAAAFTHDLDVVATWPAFTALRVVELARAGEWRRVVRVLAAAARLGDPIARGVGETMAPELAARVRATWFLLCGDPTLATLRAGDLTYSPDRTDVARVVARIQSAGHEIGLHGSFATGLDAAAMRSQRERIGRLVGVPAAGVRQHYLKMRPGATQRVMHDAGFAYDATYGFPDRNGFRLGAADVVPAWDDERRAEAGLALAPLVWMDRALSKYQRVEEPDRWADDALDLAGRARDVGGLWVGLWHPNLTDALGYPGAAAAWARVVRDVVAGEPYVAPLGEIVAWRARRRAARVRGVRPDGTIELDAHESVRLLDA